MDSPNNIDKVTSTCPSTKVGLAQLEDGGTLWTDNLAIELIDLFALGVACQLQTALFHRALPY